MALVKTKIGVTPRCLIILCAIANVAQTLDEPVDIVVTAGTNGKHMTGSKHYTGDAIDVRTKNFGNLKAKQSFVDAVLKRLGKGYQGFLESVGKPEEHLHVEYDPES